MNRREFIEDQVAQLDLNTPVGLVELKRLAIAQVKFYLELAKTKLGVSIGDVPVTFDLKGTTAGRAWCHRTKPKVQLNPTLLRENPAAFLHRTLGHEAAHLVAHAKFGYDIKPHGEEWKKVMWSLGLDNTRCHKFSTKNVPTKLGKVANKPPTVYATPHGETRTFGIGKIVEFD
jgi:predicted SprT family Zn-dependent metalloprotease